MLNVNDMKYILYEYVYIISSQAPIRGATLLTYSN